MHQVVIVGGGPAAWTAALYCARAALHVLVFEGALDGGAFLPGGQLMTTTTVENFPGAPGVTGPELVERMKLQAQEFGALVREETVERIDPAEKAVWTKTGQRQAYDALILATGASARYLGIPSEAKFLNRGVSACATCDGALPRFRNKPIIVVGGGDSSAEEAIFLTKFASVVYIVHRGPALTKASAIMRERALHNPKIQPHYNVTVQEILGDDKLGVTGVLLSSDEILECSGVFVAIGHTPNSQLFHGEKDAAGYILHKKHTETSISGVFAAGDVVDDRYRQAITAAASGCQTAIDVTRWLSEKK
jgi:thioredoxin reductase (NADPH)